ncbi:NADPH-dependent FMN reductase [Paenibacillus antri]|uniref:NADPH-dependent FMN reductase n=1 Tax=Paenibacillus antri TaxID=2582848 RepID=A0A5R9GC40_9BACL|nr:NADPH-dependent FMN reductase [Paenibacillus antri]TLS54037.1 NADPH-dependent FMN reductase [Paenibacillus antri]
MSSVVIVSGSPSLSSRVNAFIDYSLQYMVGRGFAVKTVNVSELPAEDLVRANFASAAIQEKVRWVEAAQAVILVSPVYKASYTGVLKLFLDMLPQKGLERKIVLPLFVGGSMAHLLSIDYALKPVVSALAGRHILGGVYGVDQWIQRTENGFAMTEELTVRLAASLEELASELERNAAVADPVRAERRLP